MKLQIAPLAAQGKRIEISRLDVDLTAKQPDLSIQGKLATPLTVDLDKRLADLPGLAGNLILAGKGIPNDTKAVVKRRSARRLGRRERQRSARRDAPGLEPRREGRRRALVPAGHHL